MKRGWSINIESANKKKKLLVREYDTLDRLAEMAQLNHSRINRMNGIMKELNRILS